MKKMKSKAVSKIMNKKPKIGKSNTEKLVLTGNKCVIIENKIDLNWEKNTLDQDETRVKSGQS